MLNSVSIHKSITVTVYRIIQFEEMSYLNLVYVMHQTVSDIIVWHTFTIDEKKIVEETIGIFFYNYCRNNYIQKCLRKTASTIIFLIVGFYVSRSSVDFSKYMSKNAKIWRIKDLNNTCPPTDFYKKKMRPQLMSLLYLFIAIYLVLHYTIH